MLHQGVSTFLADHRDHVLTSLARLTMVVGTNHALLLVEAVGAIVVVATRHWWREGLATAGALAAAELLSNLLKQVIERPRPPAALALVHAGGWSMPSSDAAVTSALAVALFLAFTWHSRSRRLVVALVLAFGVVIVGAALVYLGVHWTTDVLTGWLLGAGVGLAVAFGARRIPAPSWLGRPTGA